MDPHSLQTPEVTLTGSGHTTFYPYPLCYLSTGRISFLRSHRSPLKTSLLISHPPYLPLVHLTLTHQRQPVLSTNPILTYKPFFGLSHSHTRDFVRALLRLLPTFMPSLPFSEEDFFAYQHIPLRWPTSLLLVNLASKTVSKKPCGTPMSSRRLSITTWRSFSRPKHHLQNHCTPSPHHHYRCLHQNPPQWPSPLQSICRWNPRRLNRSYIRHLPIYPVNPLLTRKKRTMRSLSSKLVLSTSCNPIGRFRFQVTRPPHSLLHSIPKTIRF